MACPSDCPSAELRLKRLERCLGVRLIGSPENATPRVSTAGPPGPPPRPRESSRRPSAGAGDIKEFPLQRSREPEDIKVSLYYSDEQIEATIKNGEVERMKWTPNEEKEAHILAVPAKGG